jgi:hypothetical protein
MAGAGTMMDSIQQAREDINKSRAHEYDPDGMENFGWSRSITTVPCRGYRFCWQSQPPVEVTA